MSSGSTMRSLIIAFPSSGVMSRRRDKRTVRRIRAHTCEVKAFVEATPISGPAWI